MLATPLRTGAYLRRSCHSIPEVQEPRSLKSLQPVPVAEGTLTMIQAENLG